MKIKEIVALFLGIALTVPLSACSREAQQTTDATTTEAPVSASPSTGIVYPLTRAGNQTMSSQYYNDEYKNLYELWNNADAVVRVRIGNWLSETNTHTYYQAQTLECYKGSSPGSFVLEQMGSSQYSYINFPLFTYGNELLLFLEKGDSENPPEEKTVENSIPDGFFDDGFFVSGPISKIEPVIDNSSIIIDREPTIETNSIALPYDEYYRILDGGALMDAVMMSNGDVYLLDRYNFAFKTPGMRFVALTGEELEEVTSILSRRDPYAWGMFETELFYRMSEVLECCK